jgi:hypothetical protein
MDRNPFAVPLGLDMGPVGQFPRPFAGRSCPNLPERPTTLRRQRSISRRAKDFSPAVGGLRA